MEKQIKAGIDEAIERGQKAAREIHGEIGHNLEESNEYCKAFIDEIKALRAKRLEILSEDIARINKESDEAIEERKAEMEHINKANELLKFQ